MEGDRVRLAERFLEEAVYRSRGLQAVRVGLAGGATEAASRPGAPGNCGLGQKASVELDLSERGTELFDQLWPEGLGQATSERLSEAMSAWVTLNDSLDRKRNHFIRDFRGEHGPDRREYPAETTASYEAGLERVNQEVRDALRLAAEGLLAG